MAMPTSAAVPVARSEPRTRTALLLEGIALRHQIAVLERSGTRRPCFRRWHRLFWILFSRWWPQWRDSLIIVQAETVLRWRRDGWSALWRYQVHARATPRRRQNSLVCGQFRGYQPSKGAQVEIASLADSEQHVTIAEALTALVVLQHSPDPHIVGADAFIEEPQAPANLDQGLAQQPAQRSLARARS
jgi:hypothetical protein